MTGCYPPRVGFGAKRGGVGVLGPGAEGGLAPAERTLAEVLRDAGYATGCVGKWHLGGRSPHLPTDHGFDGFYGIPWSNNQHPLPLMRDTEVVRTLPDNPVLTGPFTIAALSFMEQVQDRPFFLYLAHSAPHWPWNVAPGRRGTAGARGIYGDTIAELDASVGALLQALEERGQAENTLVIFFSDNGPYVDARTGLGGASYPLRGAKAESWEGGVRTPFLARWPGVIPAGVRRADVATSMDLLPTLATMAGAPLDHAVDGGDIGPLLRNEPGAASPYEVLAYYARGRLEAVRDAQFKRVFANALRSPAVDQALYDLAADPGEQTDVSASHPEVVARLDAAAEGFRAELGDALHGRRGAGQRGGGWEG